MKGSEILLTAPQPRGVFLEGTMAANIAPFPGTAMQIAANTAFIGGEPVHTVYAPSADGDPRLCMILLPDVFQGQLFSTAYPSQATPVNRSRCYCPLAGEYMNVCVAPGAGTGSANAHFIGDRLIPSHAAVTVGGTTSTPGVFINTSTSSVRAWFQSMEHYDAPVDGLGWLFTQYQG